MNGKVRNSIVVVLLSAWLLPLATWASEGFFCPSSLGCLDEGKVVPQAEAIILSTVKIRSRLKNDYSSWPEDGESAVVTKDHWVIEKNWKWGGLYSNCSNPHQRYFPYIMEACDYLERSGKGQPPILPINFAATGSFVNKDAGYILTNEHVVGVCQAYKKAEGPFFCPAIEVEYKTKSKDGFQTPKVVGAEVLFMTSPEQRSNIDVALLKIPHTPPHTLSLTKIMPQVGERAKVMGYPMFSLRPDEQKGQIGYSDADGSLRLALGRVVSPSKEGVDLSEEDPKAIENMLFTDVDVVPGFSGSPTFTAENKVIGLAKRGTVQAPEAGKNANTLYVHDKSNPVWHVRSDVICDVLRTESLSHLVQGCDEQDFAYQRVHDFISSLRGRKEFPAIAGDPVENEEGAPLPDWVQTRFDEIQEFVFGRQVLELKSCKSCQMQADSKRKIVFVGSDFVNETLRSKDFQNPKDLVTFALAHEISHYIYELSIGEVAPAGKSLLLHKSLFGGTSVSENGQGLPLAAVMFDFSHGHAEVDLYAGVIMHKLGYSNFFTDVIRFFGVWLEDSKEQQDAFGVKHMKARLNAMRWLAAFLE